MSRSFGTVFEKAKSKLKYFKCNLCDLETVSEYHRSDRFFIFRIKLLFFPPLIKKPKKYN